MIGVLSAWTNWPSVTWRSMTTPAIGETTGTRPSKRSMSASDCSPSTRSPCSSASDARPSPWPDRSAPAGARFSTRPDGRTDPAVIAAVFSASSRSLWLSACSPTAAVASRLLDGAQRLAFVHDVADLRPQVDDLAGERRQHMREPVFVELHFAGNGQRPRNRMFADESGWRSSEAPSHPWSGRRANPRSRRRKGRRRASCPLTASRTPTACTHPRTARSRQQRLHRITSVPTAASR